MATKKTSNALKIIEQRHRSSVSDRDTQAAFGQQMEVAEMLFAMRDRAGLTQRELAERVGTTASVICRLENADYEGHSLAMLRRIAAALGHRLELRFVPTGRKVG